jgi:hypothetical protein
MTLVTEAGGEAAKDAIGEFLPQILSDESDKQRAKLSLQQIGASEGPRSKSILGSGEGWQRVFQ